MSRVRIASAIGCLLVLAPDARAGHEQGFGADAAAKANQRLLSNPPLPLLFFRSGDSKLTLQPAVFTGKLDYEDTDGGFHGSGDFKGFGGGVNFSQGLSDRWGWYVSASGGAVSEGDFTYKQTTSCSALPCSTMAMKNVEASYATVGAGFLYQLGDPRRGRSFPIFFGPTLTRARLKQTVQSATFSLDYDGEVVSILPGVQFGVQAGYDWGAFRLNPFLIVNKTFASACRDYDTRTVRLDGGSTFPECSKKLSETVWMEELERVQIGFGLNLVYNPWGLSFNLTGPLLQKLPFDNNSPKIAFWSVSKSFGDYPRALPAGAGLEPEPDAHEAAAADGKAPPRLGFYLAAGGGPAKTTLSGTKTFSGTVNSTNASVIVTGTSEKFGYGAQGIGVRWLPRPWLMLDAAYMTANLRGDSQHRGAYLGNSPSNGVGESQFKGKTLRASLDWISRLSRRVHGRLGLGVSSSKLDPEDAFRPASSGSVSATAAPGSDQGFTLTAPIARAGLEWRFLRRAGVSLSGQFALTQPSYKQELRLGFDTPQTTTLYEVAFPRAAVEAGLHIYF